MNAAEKQIKNMLMICIRCPHLF